MSEEEPVELNEALQQMERSQVKEFVAGIEAIWAKQDPDARKNPNFE